MWLATFTSKGKIAQAQFSLGSPSYKTSSCLLLLLRIVNVFVMTLNEQHPDNKIGHGCFHLLGIFENLSFGDWLDSEHIC